MVRRTPSANLDVLKKQYARLRALSGDLSIPPHTRRKYSQQSNLLLDQIMSGSR